MCIRDRRGSEYPEGFLTEIEASVRQAVSERGGTSQAVAIGADDYNAAYADRGYISSDAAERLSLIHISCQSSTFLMSWELSSSR